MLLRRATFRFNITVFARSCSRVALSLIERRRTYVHIHRSRSPPLCHNSTSLDFTVPWTTVRGRWIAQRLPPLLKSTTILGGDSLPYYQPRTSTSPRHPPGPLHTDTYQAIRRRRCRPRRRATSSAQHRPSRSSTSMSRRWR